MTSSDTAAAVNDTELAPVMKELTDSQHFAGVCPVIGVTRFDWVTSVQR
ncbi:hypothetical protein ACWEQA_24185 [Nocardia sp. NPDC004085]